MALTITQAARMVNLDKTTLLRAIKSGKISATRENPSKPWLIDAAELVRAYNLTVDAVPNTVDAVPGSAAVPPRSAAAEVEIRELRAGQALRDEVIADLRNRLDIATAQLGEALTQVRLLTDQRAVPAAPSTAPAIPARRTWWSWRRVKRV